jgi:geranylgeranyl diphosphate synthase type II
MTGRSLADELIGYQDLVAPLLRETGAGREPQRYLYGLVNDHLARAGKGLRPALCIATCRAMGGLDEDVVPVAAGLEMLHNAFLVHDDIEDGSLFRRERPTLHMSHGIPLAVNAGDAMQAMSVRLVRQSSARLAPDLSARLLDEMDHLLLESLEGQAWEIGWVRDNACDVTAEDYLLMTLKKTCWYSFIHPCRVGALVAENARRSGVDLDVFNRFGFFLGVAFQIQDDVLNLVGQNAKYGKEIGGDLWEGKRTLILIDLFSRLPPFEAAKLEGILRKPRGQRVARDIAWIDEAVRRTGSVDVARGVARDFAAAAATSFEAAYGPLPESDAKAFLRKVVDYVVERDV